MIIEPQAVRFPANKKILLEESGASEAVKAVAGESAMIIGRRTQASTALLGKSRRDWRTTVGVSDRAINADCEIGVASNRQIAGESEMSEVVRARDSASTPCGNARGTFAQLLRH
jgi:hypothetical protein